jgi:hypothetical protein
MPAIRPEDISNRIRLAYKVRAALRRLVSEHGAIDSLLSFAGSLVDAIVNEVSPHPNSVGSLGSEDPLFAGADEQDALPTVSVLVGAVVPLVHIEAVKVAIQS